MTDTRPTPATDDPSVELAQGDETNIASLVIAGLAFVAAVLAVVVATIALTVNEDDTTVAAGGERMVSSIEIGLTEFAIDGNLNAMAGDVVLDVANTGSAAHNIALRNGPATADLNPGDATTLDLGDLAPGTYELYCSIAGHEAAGMVAALTIDADGSAAAAGGHGGHGEDVDWPAMDEAMLDSIREYPAATEGVGNVALEPTILADGTKQFELTAAITPWEVEPGKVVDAWTYNGIVPGPSIELDVGDRIQVVIHNELPAGTDIHWHGVKTPNDQDGVAPLTQDLIRSGETYTYEFDAVEPAIGMYHAHHMGHTAIPNGLFATMIIGERQLPYGQTVSGIDVPAEGDLVLAKEMPMVLNDAGVIGFSLNGKSFPATEPIGLKAGDWMLIHYYNEGLTVHPMHLHQFPQIVVAKDGYPLDQPYAADTVNVAPGERYSVLIQAKDPGAWVWHCHILNHVERDEGMFGMVTALIVEE